MRGPTLANYLRTLHEKGERIPIPQVARLLNAPTEVGLYEESFDSPATHVHFDNLDVRNFEGPVLCKINALTMNMRNGPGTDFPSSQFIKSGDVVEPMGRTADSQWLKTKITGSDEQGWLFNATCSSSLDFLKPP